MTSGVICAAFAKIGFWPTDFSQFSAEDFAPSKNSSTLPSFPPSFPDSGTTLPAPPVPSESSLNQQESERQVTNMGGTPELRDNSQDSTSTLSSTLHQNTCHKTILPATLQSTSDRVTVLKVAYQGIAMELIMT